MKFGKEIALCAVTLMLIAGLTTAALSVTNALTAETIAARASEEADRARRQVITADAFEEISLGDTGADKITCCRALRGGATVGYVFTVTTSGKSSGLTVMTGIDADGVVTGVVITEENETAGYVDTVTKGGLPASFTGRPAGRFDIGQNIDKVSNATKTSKGVIKAVNTACAWFATVREVSE